MNTQSYQDMPRQMKFTEINTTRAGDKADFFTKILSELHDKKKMLESDYCRLPIAVNKSVKLQKKKE